MNIIRPGLEQIDGSGAAVGQVPVWDGGAWAPGVGSGVQTITPGANVAVDNADPAHPIISAGELAVMDGITNPPEQATNEAGDDFVYLG